MKYIGLALLAVVGIIEMVIRFTLLILMTFSVIPMIIIGIIADGIQRDFVEFLFKPVILNYIKNQR